MRSLAYSTILAFSFALLPAAAMAQPLPPAPAGVPVTHEYGYEFVTIGALNNAPYSGPTSNGYPGGRGSVSYEYRIARTEVSTDQWMEFANVVARQDLNLYFSINPSFWGASPDDTYTGPGRQ